MFRLAMTCLLATALSSAQTPNASQAPTSAPVAKPTGSSAAAPETKLQAPAASAAQPAAAATPAAANPDAVTANQAVITIHGICRPVATTTAKAASKKTAATSSANCATVVSKAQLDKLVSDLNTRKQPVTPQILRQFAQQYVEILTWADAAKKAGLDSSPGFAERMRYIRNVQLATVYRDELTEKYSHPPQKEIEAYYQSNLPKYEELTLSRIFIPSKNPSAQNKDEWEKKAEEVSKDIHDRAAKGEEMEKLQKEAYSTLGLTIMPPNSNMGPRRRGMLPATVEQELFSLKPGEVSKTEQEPAGYVIYKVDARQTVPLDKVKDEISRELARKTIDEKVKQVSSSVHADLNDTYFGAPATPGAPAAMPAPGSPRPGAASRPAPSATSPAAAPQPAASPSAPKP